MEIITKLFDSLPYTVKIFLGAMIGMQVLAILGWLILMRNEISTSEKAKEKQS